MNIRLTAIAIGMAAALTTNAENRYVSSLTGDDRGAGTKEAPLRSVSEAIRMAREWRRLGRPEAAGGIRIVLASGVYRQTEPLFVRPEDSGTEASPTTVCSDGGAVISGAVPVTGWTKGTDDKRIPAGVRGKILVADAPMVGNRIAESRQLCINGYKARLASQFGDGIMERMVDFNPSECTITVPVPKQDLSAARRLEMYVHQRWAIAILRVKEMKEDGKGNLVVTFHDPESRLEFSHPWPQPVIDGERGNSSFFFANAAELLDEPGEWWQDYPSGKIYYYPREGETVENITAEMPVLETVLTVAGTRERTVSNFAFENVEFRGTAWNRPSLSGHVTLQGGFHLLDAYKLNEPGLPEKAELENQAWIGRPVAGVAVKHAHNIKFTGCTFANMGATGLDFVAAVSDSEIKGCNFTDIGGTGLQIGDFPDGGFETHVPFIPANKDEICHDIKVCGNYVRNVSNEDWGCVGIGAGYVRDTDICCNEVSQVNYSGICVGWGWTALESGMRNNRIVGNKVHDYARQLYDAGGIYTLSNQPGSEIRDNHISAPHDAPYATNHRAFAIYFDEATDGYNVCGNCCPDTEFGHNRPGPAMKISDNGTHIKPQLFPHLRSEAEQGGEAYNPRR